MPGGSDELRKNEGFKNIMQGSGSSEILWKDLAPKIERIDVKSELEKLNFCKLTFCIYFWLCETKFDEIFLAYIYQPNWPTKQRKLGGVSAVSFDKAGNVVIFHRGDRVWNSGTFNKMQYFQRQSLGPIPENTVIAFHKKSGKVVYEWGKNL